MYHQHIADIGDVQEGDSQSDGVKEIYGEIGGVVKCDSYLSCLICKAKVTATGAVMGECNKCARRVLLQQYRFKMKMGSKLKQLHLKISLMT